MLSRIVAALASFLLVGCTSKASSSPGILTVRVYDSEHRLRAQITDVEGLALFNKMWQGKIKQQGPKKPRSEFHFTLVLGEQGIWLYAQDGYTTQLDHLEQPRYKLIDVAQFNNITGISP